MNLGDNGIGIDSTGNDIRGVIVALSILSSNGAPAAGDSALAPGGTGCLVNLESSLIDRPWTAILS